MQEKLHKGSLINKKLQKFVPVLDVNLSVKNAPRLSSEHLGDKICKIKQIQNIPVMLKTFLNQLKLFKKNLTPKKTPLKLTYLKF